MMAGIDKEELHKLIKPKYKQKKSVDLEDTPLIGTHKKRKCYYVVYNTGRAILIDSYKDLLDMFKVSSMAYTECKSELITNSDTRVYVSMMSQGQMDELRRMDRDLISREILIGDCSFIVDIDTVADTYLDEE